VPGTAPSSRLIAYHTNRAGISALAERSRSMIASVRHLKYALTSFTAVMFSLGD